MKTERRHELQTNTLAITLARWIEIVRPYGRAVLALVIALVVVVCAWAYLSAQNNRRLSEGWNEYFSAMISRDATGRLNDVADQYAGTIIADWARLTLADVQLEQGTNRLFQEKTVARDELRQASEKYLAILQDSQDQTLLERATFGLARAHEAQGALEKAREEYRSITKKWPKSPFAAPAESRANDLEQQNTKSFYDWLVAYEPPRPLAREPGTPGARPNFLDDPSAGGDIKLPPTGDDKSPPISITTEPPADAPASDQPVDEKPADEKPAAEKPAESPSAEAGDEKPSEPADAGGGAAGTESAPQSK